jgi:hypothetical protein
MTSTYVVSDVHGHLEDLREVLLETGLVDGDDRWTGGDTVLWMLGDLVDRGPDGIGVVHLMRSLQEQAPDSVRVLMGNHEALMLGEKRFPGRRFDDVWQLNGGLRSDQDGLTDDDVEWLRALPVMAIAGDHLLVHSDTTEYLSWGSSVAEVNATVKELLAGDDAQQCFDVFAALTSRYDFARADGNKVAREFLDTYGGEVLVHGHTIIGMLTDTPSSPSTAAGTTAARCCSSRLTDPAADVSRTQAPAWRRHRPWGARTSPGSPQ